MKSKAKWALSITGSLVLGAFCSGLWSTVFAPVGSVCMRWLMSLLTLGITSARDSIYEGASLGLYDRPSIMLLGVFGLGVMMFPLGWLTIEMMMPQMERKIENATLPELELRLQKSSRSIRFLLISLIFLGAIIFVRVMFVSYSHTVIGRFNQALSVATPYITDDARKKLLSRFASLKTREQFVTLFNEVNAINEANGKKRSDFTPW